MPALARWQPPVLLPPKSSSRPKLQRLQPLPHRLPPLRLLNRRLLKLWKRRSRRPLLSPLSQLSPCQPRSKRLPSSPQQLHLQPRHLPPPPPSSALPIDPDTVARHNGANSMGRAVRTIRVATTAIRVPIAKVAVLVKVAVQVVTAKVAPVVTVRAAAVARRRASILR